MTPEDAVGEAQRLLEEWTRQRGYIWDGQEELVLRVETDDTQSQLEDVDLSSEARALFIAAPRLLRALLAEVVSLRASSAGVEGAGAVERADAERADPDPGAALTPEEGA